MQLTYLDLYLIHAPFAFEDVGTDLHPRNEKGEIRMDTSTDHLKIWSEMERQVLEGRTKAIGLSNFNITQIKKILTNAKLPISNLQIELHVYFQQKDMVCYQFNKYLSCLISTMVLFFTYDFVNMKLHSKLLFVIGEIL